ncbi:MAG: lipoprotein-releasing ABC transporter permease subunit [Holosporales bacterium]|jgi:lipoprotein-releasing system permease protein|nr:lipoprotein-releasing ABC transporter permease subunit [Holosporales bacterium]
MSWENKIAIKYLRSKKKDGFLSVITGFSFLGICLGVATLIVVMSVMGGFREELLSRIIGMKGHVIVYSASEIPNDCNMQAKIKACRHVTQVCPTIEKQSIITSDNQMRGVLVLGLAGATLAERELLARAIQPSSAPFSGDVVIVGKRMAELMGINIGDCITLMDPQGEATAFGSVPRQRDFTVTGLLEVGMIEYDKSVVLMPLNTAQDFFQMTDALTQLEIFTDNVELSDDIARDIKKIVPNNLMVLGWKHGDSHFFQAVQVERNVMFLILTLIILIASFNIISGLVMLVNDKTRDIAILKTIGASRSSIRRIFITVGSSIGVLGTLIGIALGITLTLNLNKVVAMIQCITGSNLFSAEVYFLSELPYKVNIYEIVLIALISIALSVLATIYPSHRAAKLDPAVAIRES